MSIIMRCGCAAQGTTTDGAPICAVHLEQEPAQEQPLLEGRTAVCSYGGHHLRPSTDGLAFFEYRPAEEHDRYYCGCHGWD